MFSNPELQRQSWLEFSLQRLVVMPVVLALIFFITGKLDSKPETMSVVTLGIFSILVNFWGGLKAASAVIDDVNNGLWDLQRLSSLSPWTLTIGKLFGSTLYIWYGAFICLAFFVAFSLGHEKPDDVLFSVLSALIAGLVCHAGALLASMQDIRVRHAIRKKRHVIACFLFGMAASAIIGTPYGSLGFTESAVTWYGFHPDRKIFYLVSSCGFLAWIIAGIYWQMRFQLKMRTTPLLWAGFVAYLIFYASGFEMSSRDYSVIRNISTGSLVAFPIAMTSLYVMVFMENWNGALYRRLMLYFQRKDYEKLINQCPRWIVSFLLTLCAILWISLLLIREPSYIALGFTLLFFAVRDIAILHYFKLGKNNKRSVAAALFYLIVLYALIPLLLKVVHLPEAARFFIPTGYQGNYFVSMVSSAFQALIVSLLAYDRWQKNWMGNSNPAARPA